MIEAEELDGSISEIADNDEGENSEDHLTTGELTFTDVDLADGHTLSVAPGGAGYRGTLLANISDASTGDGNGEVSWEFSINDADIDDLAEEQELIQTYTLEIDDGNGGLDSREVAITISGSNDAPTVEGGVLAANEDGASVDINLATLADDVDNDDNRSTLGYALINSPPINASLNGSILSFDPGSDFQSLAQDETTDVAVDFSATDAHGASSDNSVNVTVTGVNDDPTLASGALAVTEDGDTDSLNLATLGDDIDSDDDGDSLSYALINSPHEGASIEETEIGNELIFDPDDAFQHLAQDETTTVTLDVQATDGHGATATNTVEVTVTGVNDNPEIDSEGSTGEVILSPGSAPFTVEQWTGFNHNHGANVALSTLQNHAAANTPNYTATTNIIDYTDDPAGFAGLIPGSSPWPAAQATGATATNDPVNDNFMARITTNIVITQADTYTFRTFNDDGVYLLVDGQLVINDPQHHAEQQKSGQIYLEPGVYSLELYFFEGGGEASLELAFSGSDGVFQHVGSPDGTDSGSIQFSDVDLTDSHTASAAGVGTVHGSMTAVVVTQTDNIDGDGGVVNWEYTIDNNAYQNLGAGDTATETFIVSVDDGNGGVAQETVEITIVGANDPAVLGNAVEDLTETDAQQTVNGTLSISDPDDDEAFFNPQTDTETDHGFFSIDANGNWSFTTDGPLDELAEGELVTDIIEVTSLDGTATTVTINITGTSDGPTAEADTNSLTASAVDASNDNTVYWVDWTPTTLTPAPFGGRDVVHTINGVIDLPGLNDIHVSYTGQVFTGATQLAGGTDYYVTKNGGHPGPVVSTEGVGVYTSPEVGNGPTNNDIITLNHADSPRNLTFKDSSGNPLSIENLFFAIVSMNNNGYLFDQGFSVVSSADSLADSGFWGYSAGFNLIPGGPGQLGISTLGISPNEFHGVLAIENALQSLTWTSQGDEAWNGFTIGTYGLASSATASGNVLTNDDIGGAAPIEVSDVDGNAMVGNSVTINLASGAILKVDKDGDYLYDDNGAFGALLSTESHTDIVTYTVEDANGNTDTATLSITVDGIDDEAVLGSAEENITETDAQQTIGGTLSISDPDAGQAFFNSQTDTETDHGFFSIDANGVWSFTTDGALDELADGEVVTDIIEVTSLDGTSTTVTINITGTPDGPTAVADTNSLTASSGVTDTGNTVYWVDWGTITPTNSGVTDEVTIDGTITLPGNKTIGVTYTGQIYPQQTFISDSNGTIGTNFWHSTTNPGSPLWTTTDWIDNGDGVYTSASIANGPGSTNNDFIALALADTPRNLTFSEPVSNLFFAVASMNNNGYLFDQPFTVVSSADGPNDQGNWGYTSGITLSENNGQHGISTAGASPNEFHGVLGINNAVSSLTWVSQSVEYWQGFTVGTYGVAQSATVSGNVLTNDDSGAFVPVEVSDIDGNAMVGNSVTINLASGAILKVDRDGDYFYDDNGAFVHLGANASHTDTVTYTVTDANGFTDTATLSITVDGVNDAPTANDVEVIWEEDGDHLHNPIHTSLLLLNDTDPDAGDTLTVVSVQNAVNGSVSLSGSQITFTSIPNFNGTASFEYTMQDAAGETSTATVTIPVDANRDVYTVDNLISNGSFETGLDDWTPLNGGVDRVGDWQAADGTYLLDLNAFTPGGVSQALNNLTDGNDYHVIFSLSQNPGAHSSTVQVAAENASQDFTFNLNSSHGNMKWSSESFSFTADGTSGVLSFTSLTPNPLVGHPDDAEGPALDDVIVVEHQVIENFDLVTTLQDVIDLRPILNAIDADPGPLAFFTGYLNFHYDSSDTVIQIDPDGGADNFLDVVTLVGVELTVADTDNYLLI